MYIIRSMWQVFISSLTNYFYELLGSLLNIALNIAILLFVLNCFNEGCMAATIESTGEITADINQH